MASYSSQKYFLNYVMVSIIAFYSSTLSAKNKSADTPLPNPKVLQQLLKDKIFVKTSIESNQNHQKQQILDYYIAGLHPASCPKALRKLSLYQHFKDYFSHITQSLYNEKNKEIFIRLDHPVLPHPFTLNFQLPRITKEGSYPFIFKKGIFNNLQGWIYVSTYTNRCLFQTQANWTGKHTGYPDTLIEIFSDTLSRIAMEKLFRATQF